MIALGGNKQASINIFKGRQLVDLREYYNAGALQQGSTGCDVCAQSFEPVRAPCQQLKMYQLADCQPACILIRS